MPQPRLTSSAKAQILAEGLPYIRSLHGKTFVIRYGGVAMTDPALKTGFGRDITLLQLVGVNPIVVHGGEPLIGRMLAQMGIPGTSHDGIRVVDERTMNVVEMVQSELNQEIVNLINQHGGKAVGLDGQDGRFIRAERRLLPPDLGFVGVVEGIDPDIIRLLHSRGFIPVIMPIGVGAEGESFDIDADEVATRIAVVLQAEKLILMTDTPGVSDRNGALITGARMSEIEAAVADRRIDVARHPGLLSALDAIRNGVPSSHIIDGRIPSALLLEVLTSGGVGTLILSDAGPHFLDDSRHYLARPVPA